MTTTQSDVDWMQKAKCDGQGDLFFSEMQARMVNKARAICKTCEVKQQCLAYALENNEVGVWAGTTTNQRRKIRNRTLKISDMSWL